MPTKIRPIYPGITPRPIRVVVPNNRFGDPIQLPKFYVDGVLEGGITLGTAYLGSLRLLEQKNIWFKRIAGNSAGAITAAMIAAGYTANEIEWLCSGYPNPPRRPNGIHNLLQPIDFLDFLDFPTLNTIGTPARRMTLFWKICKGQIIDNILNKDIPVPTRKKAEDNIIAKLKADNGVIGNAIKAPGVEPVLRNLLRQTLLFLPTTTPKLKDFQILDSENLRINFADAIWSAVASVNPTLVFSTQLIYEGGIFEGRVFYDTIHRILGAKVHNNPDADVLFNQLPIPLAVIGANIGTGRMEVYSVRTHPTMIVAEAVRRTMSMPVIFEPKGNLVVDGGLCSNFPAWLLTSAGDTYWPVNSIDENRPKIGFTLDEYAAPPVNWHVSDGKFRLSGNPPMVDIKDVLIPVLIAKLKDQGLYAPSITLPETDLARDLNDWKLLKVIVGWAKMNQEDSVRRFILQAIFKNIPFFMVNIPLKGFHGFDFAINGDKDDLESIAERGWFAARDGLAAIPTNGSNPLIASPGSMQNPY